jgi:transcriptional antiterminator NusG
LSDDEVKGLGVMEVLPMMNIAKGDAVKVTEGPFENFMGTVDEIHEEKRKLKVFISMFGRETLVELDFEQVEKV